ncbi:MAG: methyltransferase domain-containing protein [Candidatus Woesebacteria bacterium]|nr:MAG: methyltransferase domain-containing protein [Candidatus Woesebacteria bacterium]
MFGTKILEEKKSKFNGDIRVVKTWGMGTYIQANGLTQSGGIVESIWKQTLKKAKSDKQSLPSDGKLKVKSVLILGLGGGTVAKIVRKNWPEAKITGIDIDPLIVELGNKYMGLQKHNVKTIISDASNLPSQKFDLIIIDLYNGDKFPEKFEKDNYLKLVGRHLTDNGIAVFNRLYYKEKNIEAEEFGKKLKKIFKNVEPFRPVSNMMYICTN